MKHAIVALALFWQAMGPPSPHSEAAPRYFRYQRTIVNDGGYAGQACAVLDAAVFAHASSESLADLRLYAQPGDVETPFALSISGTQNEEEDAAQVQDLGVSGADIVFDAAMPARPYSSVTLQLSAKDFTGTVDVTGHGAASAPVSLGQFAIFDLSSQHLARSTALPLQEVTFPTLHFVMHLQPAPGSAPQTFTPSMVTGVTVPPTREAQTLYTVVAVAPPFSTSGRDSVTIVPIAPHVPVDRVTFAPGPSFHNNFLRDVALTETAGDNDASSESVRGEISHVKLAAAAAQQGSERSAYSIDTPFAANLKRAVSLRIAVHNGDDPPLPLQPARLEMRQRRICFDASPGVKDYALMYGDATLLPPVYDYARLFHPSPDARLLPLGAETINPSYAARADTRPFTERHPELLWTALFAVVALLGSMTLRSARSRTQ